MGIREWIAPRLQDRVMRIFDELRPEAVAPVHGEVLEVGFGTALNLEHFGDRVSSVTGLDPMTTDGVPAIEQRISEARFPVHRTVLRADGELPFDAGRFDCVLTTWTLCSIPDPQRALAEMRRVLAPGGHYVFIEHGLSSDSRTARWQHRLNPIWRRLSGGCNMDRRMDELIERAGFELVSLDRFRGPAPGLLASMYRGMAKRASRAD